MNEGVSQIPSHGAGRIGGNGLDPTTGAVGSTETSGAVGPWGFHLGAVTQQVDGTVILFWVFAIFFGALVWYLRAEDKREGYPMEDPTVPERAGPPVGFPPPPAPKTFNLLKGGSVTLPQYNSPPEVPMRHLHPFPGSAWEPTGANPMRDPVGPASYCLRWDEPILLEGERLQIVPMREIEHEWHVQSGDADPRGLPVVGRDGKVAGRVRDLWIDRGVKILRYLEIELNDGRHRLMPIFFANVSPKFRQVKTRSIYAEQFAAVPELKEPNRVTAREEDRICAYFASGKMFAEGVRNGSYGRTQPGDERRGGDVLGLRKLLGRRHSA